MDRNTQTAKTKPQLAVFDIDGTITPVHGKLVPKEVLDGFAHLREQGIITTVCTGRPFVRMRENLGEQYDKIISDTALIAVEHGAKIVDKQGNVVVQSAFDPDDIDKFIEFTGLNIDIVHFLAYNPSDLSQKTQLWCPEPSDVETFTKERGWYADVTTGSLLEVKADLLKQPISNVSIKLRPHIKVENLKLEFTGGSIKAVFQDGSLEYMKSKVNKARSISYICKYFGIYEQHLLVAGNAINDVDMLNMEAGHRILVGKDGPEREMLLGYLYGHDYLEFLETPEALGHYLQKI